MATEVVEQGIRTGEWLTIMAALLGPILAVQAQKIVEASRAKRAERDWVFRTLMATRAARLSTEHVRALNMIDMAFYGFKFWGFHYQRPAAKAVTRDWKAYFDTLGTSSFDFSPDQEQRLNESRDDKFTDLLASMAIAQNYDFDKVHLRRSMYSPQLHADIDADQRVIREGLARVLTGKSTIKMDVVNFPEAAQVEDPTPRSGTGG
jgi:hypothetical protein